MGAAAWRPGATRAQPEAAGRGPPVSKRLRLQWRRRRSLVGQRRRREEPNGWFVALAIPGFPLLIGGVLFVLQAILSSLNGSSSDRTVADHLRGELLFLVVGGLLCAPLFASMRDVR